MSGWSDIKGLKFTVINELAKCPTKQQGDEAKRQRYEFIEEALDAVIFDYSSGTEEIFVSDGFYTMLGFQPGEFDSDKETLADLIHPDDRTGVFAKFSSITEPKSKFQLEYRLKKRNGEWLWVQAKVLALATQGKVGRIVGVCSDISARKALEKQVQLDNVIMNNSSLGMIVLRRNGAISRANQAICQLLDYRQNELQELQIFDLDNKFKQQVVEDKVRKLKKNASYKFRSHFKAKTGREVPVEVVVNFINYSDDICFVVFVQDISKTLNMEAQLQRNYAKLAEAQHMARLGYWEMDLQTKTTTCSNEARRIFGMPFAQRITFRDLLARVAVENWRRCYNKFWNSVQQKQRYEDEFKLQLPHGETKYVRLQARHTYDHNLRPLRSFGTVLDMTEKWKWQEQINALTQENALIIEHIQTAISLVGIQQDGQFYYKKVNPAYEDTVCLAKEDIIGKTPTDIFGSEDGARMIRQYQLCVDKGEILRYESSIVTPKGIVYLYNVLVPVKNAEGINSVLGSSLDISSLVRQEEEIRFISYHDSLTGLYNYAYYDYKLRELDQEQYLPLSVIVGDGNGLKIINDVFGHAKGDAYLKRLAEILLKSCPSKSVVCRTGGDEFTILLPNTDEEEVQQIVANLKQQSQGVYVGNIPVSFSVGVATKHYCDEDWDSILKIADNHMYNAKLFDGKKQKSDMLKMLSQILLTKANETEEHSNRLRCLSVQLGECLGLTPEQLAKLELLAYFHDIGKVAIADKVLNKPGRLTSEEWTIIKTHSAIGYCIAMTTPELAVIAEDILGHHERWDGTGYPEGKRGFQIPLLARIIAITDAYDAIVNTRVYRLARSKEDALTEIKINAGTQFDPTLAKCFIEMMATEDL